MQHERNAMIPLDGYTPSGGRGFPTIRSTRKPRGQSTQTDMGQNRTITCASRARANNNLWL
jgi:hypothetical protein